jgi:hypothetical protein
MDIAILGADHGLLQMYLKLEQQCIATDRADKYVYKETLSSVVHNQIRYGRRVVDHVHAIRSLLL